MKTWGAGEGEGTEKASCPASAQSNSLEMLKRSDIGFSHRYEILKGMSARLTNF
jgi:hypothetical protein